MSKFDAGSLLTAVLTLFISQNLFQPGLPTLADLPIHLYRTLEYGQAWSAGVIIPRWAPNLAYGYGYPLFIFAPPLPYWLALLFQLPGRIVLTAGALEVLDGHPNLTRALITRHVTGDWSEMRPEDQAENEFSVSRRLRIFSAYTLADNSRLWIITPLPGVLGTEADRSATTILLPQKY